MHYEKKAGPELARMIYKSNNTGDKKVDAQNIVHDLLDYGLMPSKTKIDEAGYDHAKCKMAYEDYFTWLDAGKK